MCLKANRPRIIPVRNVELVRLAPLAGLSPSYRLGKCVYCTELRLSEIINIDGDPTALLSSLCLFRQTRRSVLPVLLGVVKNRALLPACFVSDYSQQPPFTLPSFAFMKTAPASSDDIDPIILVARSEDRIWYVAFVAILCRSSLVKAS